MSILALERNYIPIDIETRLHACLRRTVSEWPIRKNLSFYYYEKKDNLPEAFEYQELSKKYR